MTPTREIFWNIGDVRTLVHLLMFIPLLFLVYGLFCHFRFYLLGKRGKGLHQVPKRMVSLFLTVFTHRTILKDRYAGLMHLFVFWGFSMLFLGTIAIFIQDSVLRTLLGPKFLHGRFYLLFKSTLDLSGILVLLGASMGIYRRYVLKPSKLDTGPEYAFVFSLILLITLSGFSLEGLRLSVLKPSESLWSPVGFVFGSFFESICQENWRLAFHRTLWWAHLGLSFLFVAYLPFSKLLHIFSSSFNIFVNCFAPSFRLQPLDFSSERFGVNRIKDFERDSLLALDACTECGRCQSACPAYLSEKPLNPKKIILNLQKLKLRFSVLGREETCCGDVVRRTGNEYLFKAIAEKNIEFFEQRGITKIVTHCPHCFIERNITNATGNHHEKPIKTD